MASWGSSAFVKEYVGCYSSIQPLKQQGSWTFQSSDYCQEKCEPLNQPVLGLSEGDLCWCGSQLPADSDKVSDSQCNTPCQGWPDESCGGGKNYYSIWLTGEQSSVPSYGGSGDDSSSSSSSTTSSTSPTSTNTSPTRPPTVVTSTGPGTTIVVTKPAEASSTSQPTDSSSGGSTNVAGVAAGVVVGVVAAVSIITGLVFFLRHRRRKAAEEEYARTQQVSDFMRGGSGKPPTTGYSSHSDSRLDPEANKRNSAGSLADDQDYSRRILRVANPDRS